MTHPLLHLFAIRPQLLADHAQAYAELLSAEIGRASAAWKRQALLSALALCCLAVALVLAGVAVMLWSLIPMADMRVPWALLAVPLLPSVLAVWCLLAVRAQGKDDAFDNVRQQLQADFDMLRQAGAP